MVGGFGVGMGGWVGGNLYTEVTGCAAEGFCIPPFYTGFLASKGHPYLRNLKFTTLFYGYSDSSLLELISFFETFNCFMVVIVYVS